jgi:hypothetical protein
MRLGDMKRKSWYGNAPSWFSYHPNIKHGFGGGKTIIDISFE